MRVNIQVRSGDRVGRARLSETAGSPTIHRPIRPNALASRNGSRPNRVQLRPRSCGLGETRPTCAAAGRRGVSPCHHADTPTFSSPWLLALTRYLNDKKPDVGFWAQSWIDRYRFSVH